MLPKGKGGGNQSGKLPSIDLIYDSAQSSVQQLFSDYECLCKQRKHSGAESMITNGIDTLLQQIERILSGNITNPTTKTTKEYLTAFYRLLGELYLKKAECLDHLNRFDEALEVLDQAEGFLTYNKVEPARKRVQGHMYQKVELLDRNELLHELWGNRLGKDIWLNMGFVIEEPGLEFETLKKNVEYLNNHQLQSLVLALIIHKHEDLTVDLFTLEMAHDVSILRNGVDTLVEFSKRLTLESEWVCFFTDDSSVLNFQKL